MSDKDKDKKKKVKIPTIVRGDDSDFGEGSPILLELDTEADLTGYTASLEFQSLIKEFDTEEVSSKLLSVSYTAEETMTFLLGKNLATIKITDTSGNQKVLSKFAMQTIVMSPLCKLDYSEESGTTIFKVPCKI